MKVCRSCQLGSEGINLCTSYLLYVRSVHGAVVSLPSLNLQLCSDSLRFLRVAVSERATSELLLPVPRMRITISTTSCISPSKPSNASPQNAFNDCPTRGTTARLPISTQRNLERKQHAKPAEATRETSQIPRIDKMKMAEARPWTLVRHALMCSCKARDPSFRIGFVEFEFELRGWSRS